MRRDKFGPKFPLLSKLSLFLGGNREDFFQKTIQQFLSKYDPGYALIEKAYNIAKKEFAKVLRDGGERYFEHLRDVTLICILWLRVKDPNAITAYILHDLSEDFPLIWPIERIEKEFNAEIAYYVDCMTKPKKIEFASAEMRDNAYHIRLESAPISVKKGKLADRLHNIITLDGCPTEKQVRKIAETEGWYIITADKHGILYHELIEALTWIKTQQTNTV